eukprot:6180658-Pleurochrysis_carterae.AAC.6
MCVRMHVRKRTSSRRVRASVCVSERQSARADLGAVNRAHVRACSTVCVCMRRCLSLCLSPAMTIIGVRPCHSYQANANFRNLLAQNKELKQRVRELEASREETRTSPHKMIDFILSMPVSCQACARRPCPLIYASSDVTLLARACICFVASVASAHTEYSTDGHRI